MYGVDYTSTDISRVEKTGGCARQVSERPLAIPLIASAENYCNSKQNANLAGVRNRKPGR